MPLANAFLRPEELGQESFFDLAAAFCLDCGMVQLLEQPACEKMFHAEYPFFTGSSQFMKNHFEKQALKILAKYPPSSDPFIVEIGSNDGTFLSHFTRHGVRHAGFEPAGGPAEIARAQGVQTVPSFFDAGSASDLAGQDGRADVIFAANVMCHMPNLHSVFEGVSRLLKPAGVFIFEDPYLGDVLSGTAYDQIYDEHVFLFSVRAVMGLARRHGMEVSDLEPVPVHGGSMRFTVNFKGSKPVSPRVDEALAVETQRGLDKAETFHQFRRRVEESRDALKNLLEDLKKKGKRVMGYAATSKSTTVLNYCGITPGLLESICDTTPAKQGKLSPGAHIPVVPYEDFKKNNPDYALLFAWNHRQEIFAKEAEFSRGGGQWILFVPEVQILGAGQS